MAAWKSITLQGMMVVFIHALQKIIEGRLIALGLLLSQVKKHLIKFVWVFSLTLLNFYCTIRNVILC